MIEIGYMLYNNICFFLRLYILLLFCQSYDYLLLYILYLSWAATKSFRREKETHAKKGKSQHYRTVCMYTLEQHI